MYTFPHVSPARILSTESTFNYTNKHIIVLLDMFNWDVSVI